jgi:hypothetical protein
MPTAAKLFAGVLFAALGWYAAHVFRLELPEGSRVGFLREGTALIGLICGWRILGRLAGRGYFASIGTAFRTALTMVFFTLLLFSIYLMVMDSVRMRYDGPMEAVLGIFDKMLEFGRLVGAPQVIGVLAAGSVLAAILTEFAGRRWK